MAYSEIDTQKPPHLFEAKLIQIICTRLYTLSSGFKNLITNVLPIHFWGVTQLFWPKKEELYLLLVTFTTNTG